MIPPANRPIHAPAPRQLALSNCAPEPWRNGGGLTRELLAAPAGPGWRWRVSVAEIAADGPFSAYPGVERWFAVVEGAGVELALAAGTVTLRPGDAPRCFNGAEAPGCRLLAGPTRDLNLMLRGPAGRLETVESEAPWQPQAAQCGLYAAVPGTLQAGESAWPVAAHTLAWFDAAPVALRFVPESAAAVPGWWAAVDDARPAT